MLKVCSFFKSFNTLKVIIQEKSERAKIVCTKYINLGGAGGVSGAFNKEYDTSLEYVRKSVNKWYFYSSNLFVLFPFLFFSHIPFPLFCISFIYF
jgi:hypothetical protein